MLKTSNFHPEWGYLAPAPSFMRTARLVLLATAIGGTLGAGAVFSWAGHQTTEPSVGERTLVRLPEVASARHETSIQAAHEDSLPLAEKQPLASHSRSTEGTSNEPRARSTTPAPAGIAAIAVAPAATEGPSTTAITAPAAAAKDPALNPASAKRKATKKSNATWRLALRDEPFGLAPGEYSKRRTWGGYYGEGGRRYENW
jgi:hypothetical protein